MIDIAILEKLDACEKAQRLENLQEVLKTTQFPPMVPQYINNHIHTTYSFSPYSPTAAVYAARMEGLALPGQFGVVALDEPPTGGEAFVLTRTVFSAARIADAVVDQLFGALSGETGPVRRTVPGELLLGGSCR